MIDFHSHILPQIDDGSKDLSMSLSMLEESDRAGVKLMVATPHFYADRQQPEDFLTKRALAYNSLIESRSGDQPIILLGAELHYYEGMSRSELVPQLCIEGTDLLMLEMPMVKWSARMVDEVFDLIGEQPVTVIMAHFERYMDSQPKDIWAEFRRCGVLMQANANFFINRNTRRVALNMLDNGEIDLLGSDCHNMTSRKPNIGKAMQLIEAGLGKRLANSFVNRGRELLLSHRSGEPEP